MLPMVFKKKYANKAQKAIEAGAKNAQKSFNAQKNSVRAQQFQQKASKATFNGILNNIQNQAKAQLQKIKDPKARKNLLALLDNGAQQAKDQLKKQRLLHANIKKTVETKVAPQLKERGGKLQNEIDTAIGNF